MTDLFATAPARAGICTCGHADHQHDESGRCLFCHSSRCFRFTPTSNAGELPAPEAEPELTAPATADAETRANWERVFQAINRIEAAIDEMNRARVELDDALWLLHPARRETRR